MRQNLTLADLPPMSQEEKEWWEEHNSEYYHYFYRIDNISNGKFYYGIHSQRIDSGKLPDNDGYMGSGTDLKKAQAEEGIENFKKTIVKTFSTRDEARLEEMMIVDEDLVNDPMCYNKVCGGGYNPTSRGIVLVNYRDESVRKEKMFRIPVEEYHLNPDEYITVWSERGTFKNIEDFSDIRYLSLDDPLVISGQFIGITSGTKQSEETISKKVGEKNGSYGTMWITDGKENIKINKGSQLPIGWKKGRTISDSTVRNISKVKYINKDSLESRWMTREEFEKAPKDLWFTEGFFIDGVFITYQMLQDSYYRSGSWSSVSKNLGKNRETLLLVRDYYINLGYTFSSPVNRFSRPGRIGLVVSRDGISPNKINIHKDGENLVVLESEVEDYLSNGWKRGKLKE